jgi:hypothetical protein
MLEGIILTSPALRVKPAHPIVGVLMFSISNNSLSALFQGITFLDFQYQPSLGLYTFGRRRQKNIIPTQRWQLELPKSSTYLIRQFEVGTNMHLLVLPNQLLVLYVLF